MQLGERNCQWIGAEGIRSLVRIIARFRLFRHSAVIVRASWTRAARAGSTAECREIKRLAGHLVQCHLLVCRNELFDLLDLSGADLLLIFADFDPIDKFPVDECRLWKTPISVRRSDYSASASDAP